MRRNLLVRALLSPTSVAQPNPCWKDSHMIKSTEVNCVPNRALANVCMSRFSAAGLTMQSDALAVEEPLEIRLGCDVDGRRAHRAVSITMRTPGHDQELAVGYLFTEGILAAREQVTAVRACGMGNVVRVDLLPGTVVDLSRLERNFYAASSCGVCGKASLKAVRVKPQNKLMPAWPIVEAAVIERLPEKLRAAQVVF